MRKNLLLTMFLLLSIVAPFAAFADSFTIKPIELELGKSATLQFNLENDQEFVGFQADVTLPAGITFDNVKLSDRATAAGEYNLNCKQVSSGAYRMTAFSGQHTAFTGTDGVLVNMTVNVTDEYKGGKIDLYNIIFTDKENKDVTLTASSITPNVLVSEIALSSTSLALKVGAKGKLTATLSPTFATDNTVTWTSDKEDIATVANGEVTAVAEGKATITATSSNGKTATCVVNVATNVVEVESVTIDKTLSLKEGETATLTATVLPADATNTTITWTSSDTSVATVDANGKVTAKKVGTTTITAASSNPEVTATCTVTVSPIEAESVEVSASTAELKVGETIQLTATVLPDNTSDKTVTWMSDNDAVATVDANGKVTAKGIGTASVNAFCGQRNGTCVVTVVKTPVETVTLDKTTLSLTEGESDTLKATVAPADATDKTIAWTSSDEAIATVKDGVVTAVKAGKATITATADGKTATCEVTVAAKTIAVTGVTLDKTEASLAEGETVTLTATVAPANATDKTVAWTTSDAKIATVENGVVTAVAAGTATITATASGKTATCTVTVTAKAIAVESVTLDETSAELFEGESLTLTATVAPSNATDKTVAWASDNEAIATVKNGVVTAVAVGTANITATAGGKTATCKVTVVADDRTSVPVKMTYVNMDDPAKAYGEIAEGETAQSGYNKISGGSVGFVNTGWGVNYITYLQVNVSEIKGTIINATLSFEASGSTDSKRTTGWGVGYNNSVWPADMTYDSADKSITTMGAEQWTTTKSATTFESFSFDITEAVLNAENGLATILVYETAAAGGYIKNPVVKVKWTDAATYGVTFKETNGVEATVVVNKLDVTKGTSLPDGTYKFTATANGYKNYSGEFTVDGAPVAVEFAMTPKETWNYTVKANVDDAVVATGSDLEGASITVPYSRYILAKDGTVWMKAPCGGDKKMEYNYTFTPDANNYVATLDYTEYAADGIYFIEGENIEGMSVVTRDNASVRCSNDAGGHSEEVVNVYTLKPGTYKVAIGVWGNAGATFIVKAGEETVISATTQGYWYESVSEEFTVEEETVVTFEGSTTNKPLDYILITGKAAQNVAVEGIVLDQTKIEELVEGTTVKLTATVSPENATDPTVTWSSSDVKVATVDAEGTVTAVAPGTATITAKAGEKTATCVVTVVAKYVPVEGLAILDEDENVLDNTHSLALYTGDEYTLTEVVSPENATEQRVTWTSSDEAVAKIVDIVEEPHQVHIDAIAPGEATITATLGDFSTTFKVTVTEPTVYVEAVKLDITKADMKTGETLQLTATIEPDNASSKEVKWTSSDNTIATVSTKGVVKALKAGNVTITATAGVKKLTATCEITITDIEVEEITLDKEAVELEEGATVQLTATVAPENATDSTVTWSSSDEAVATVDENGVVTAVAAGEAIITAAAGDKTAECVVTVKGATVGVDMIGFDSNAPVKVYDLNGRYVSDKVENLATGFYIFRQGNTAKKVRIK